MNPTIPKDALNPIDPTQPVLAPPKGVRFYIGLAIVFIGYTTALFGSIAFFKIPLVQTIGLMLVGATATLLPTWIDRRLGFPNVGRAYTTTNVVGSFLIIAILAAFASSNWTKWYIHPAGFQTTWIFSVAAFFHFRNILTLFPSKNCHYEVPITDDESQKDNPYEPPLRTN